MPLIIRHSDVLNNHNYGRTINQVLVWYAKPLLPGKDVIDSCKALFVELFDDGRKPNVKINKDVRVSMKLTRLPRPMDIGQIISVDLKEIVDVVWPKQETDGNSAKILVVRFNKDFWILNFDFRYNKKDAQQKLERANEFLSAGKALLGTKSFCPHVLIYLIWSCAELIVDTKLFLIAQRPKQNHNDRKKKVKIWNPDFAADFSNMFLMISKLKNPARYATKNFSHYDKEKIKKYIHILENEIGNFSL